MTTTDRQPLTDAIRAAAAALLATLGAAPRGCTMEFLLMRTGYSEPTLRRCIRAMQARGARVHYSRELARWHLDSPEWTRPLDMLTRDELLAVAQGRAMLDHVQLEVAGLFVCMTVDGRPVLDDRGRVLVLHSPREPAAGDVVVFRGQRMTVESVADGVTDVPCIAAAAMRGEKDA